MLAGDRKDYMELRKLVVRLVMMTDLSKHFESIAALNGSAEGSLQPAGHAGGENRGAVEGGAAGGGAGGASAIAPDITLALTVAIKGADLGHSIKPWVLHLKWSLWVTEEFFALGDRERAAGIPISTFCDRERDTDLAKSQGATMR